MSRERIRKWRTAGAALRLGLHVCALVVLTPTAVPAAEVSGPETVFAETDVIAGPGITDWAFGDPLGAGRQDLLVARGNRVEVYAQSGAGTYEPVHTFVLPHAAPAIAAADVNHDAVDEILVGTAGAGSIRIYSVSPSGGAVRVGDTRYTWATVRAVRTGDVDGDGWTDVAALNQEGVGTLFRWTVSGWEQVWREPATAGPAVSFLDLTDMDGDGRAELVVARANGYVGVWRWTGASMAPAWENYPWGNPFAVGLVDIDADGHS
ncbi:MAG TPA: VCBS repeat-containing protein, partial [Limnochordia bacterium]